MIDTRQCTCHPDDLPPVPCPKKYALRECRLAAAEESNERLRDALRRAEQRELEALAELDEAIAKLNSLKITMLDVSI